MNILLNGDQKKIDKATLSAALAQLGYADTVVATAVNGTFVPAGERDSHVLRTGDQIEVLAPMQGG